MCRLWWFFNSYWRLMSSPVSVPVFMCTQVWSPHLEQTVSLGPLSVSLLLIKGFTLDVSSSSTVGPDLLLPVVLKSIFIWRTMMMQTWAHVELPYHFSVPWWPLANGCLPGSCSMFQSVLPQGLGTSSLTFSPSLHTLGSSIFHCGPSKTAAPFRTHFVSSCAENLPHAAHCHLSLSWGLHNGFPSPAWCHLSPWYWYPGFPQMSIPLTAAQPFLEWSSFHPSQQQYSMAPKGSPCLRTAVNFSSSPSLWNFL